jgi:hypothetical protein
MDGMIPLDLGLPASPLRSFEVVGTLQRHGSAAPPPVACPPEVMSVHTAELSEWRMPVLAVTAGVALTVAEALVPEAAGATWTVTPAQVAQTIS